MPTNASREPAGSSAPALRRAVQILDKIAELPSPPTFTDIVSLLGLPKSSAHGLCATLVELGLLIRSDAGTYRLGAHTMRWANGFLRQTDIVGEFQRLLQERRELAQFTLTLTILDGQQVVYLACSNTNSALGFTFRIGMRLPAAFTATGKAMLSRLSDQEVMGRLGSHWPQPLTAHSVSTPDALAEELRITRQRGFSIDDGQIREGMLCIGAAVSDFSDAVCAGIAVSMLAVEATDQRVNETGRILVDIAHALSQRLGSSQP